MARIPKTSKRHIRSMMKDIAGERVAEAMATGGEEVAAKVAQEIAHKAGPTVAQRAAAKVTAGGIKAADGALKVGATVAQAAGGFAGHKAEQLVGTAKGIDNVLFKKVGFDERTFGRKMRPGAFGVFMGGAAVVGTAQGFREVDQEQMGAKDPNIYRATPTVPSYFEDGGATGDLVFSLHDLRNGGR